MYIERDAKIILIYRSIIGIVFFVAFYIVLLKNQQVNPNDNFDMLQLMIFGIIFILTAILLGSIISLKREISRQQEYLKILPQKAALESEKYVKIPYNKAGLYSLIVASLLGIISFLYLYGALIIQPQTMKNTNFEMLSTMILVFVIIFIVILLATFYVFIKRIRTPLYYDMKVCPRCGSNDVHKVEYSWWGGLIGPGLVHQVQCKKCGKTYDGSTGTNITKKASTFITIALIIYLIIVIIKTLV
jgi:hypothetical protein